MTVVTLYGIGLSSYVRTCRLALEEKGVSYEHIEYLPQSPEQLVLHPFGKVPAFAHGDVKLFETLAICRYVDAVFGGPDLQPADPVAQAHMDQWISAYVDNIYGPMVVDMIIQRVLVPKQGGTTDEAVVKEAAQTMARHFAILDHVLGESDYFAGDKYSLADMFYLPAMGNFLKLPEASLLNDKVNLRDWFERCSSRPASLKLGIGG